MVLTDQPTPEYTILFRVCWDLRSSPMGGLSFSSGPVFSTRLGSIVSCQPFRGRAFGVTEYSTSFQSIICLVARPLLKENSVIETMKLLFSAAFPNSSQTVWNGPKSTTRFIQAIRKKTQTETIFQTILSFSCYSMLRLQNISNSLQRQEALSHFLLRKAF